MALVRHDQREVQFKIVYCGPPRGGKTTNLRYIHRRLDPALRGDLVSVATERNRTVAFDYLPIHETVVAGYRTCFQLFATPGQRLLSGIRQQILAGADAAVFVADSSPDRLDANLEAWLGFRDSLAANGIDPDRIPVAYQYNKRDRPDAMPPADLDELFGVRSPGFLASALSGFQVFATLDWAAEKVLSSFHGVDCRTSSDMASSTSGVHLLHRKIRPAETADAA